MLIFENAGHGVTANIHALGACDSGFESQCPDQCGCRIVAIISPFQGEEEGSNPFTRSMHYVYILLLNNKNLYKGTTENLKRRIKEHNSGKVESTKHKRPIKLIHYETYLLKSDAERRERFLKTTEGRKFLKQQIRDILNKTNKGSPGHPTGQPG